MNVRKYDCIVAGAGLAGLFSAIFCAAAGKKTLVVTRGAGSLIIGGGTLDILGYDSSGRYVNNPLEAISSLSSSHPYSLLGADVVSAAVTAFSHITEKYGYPYICAGRNVQVPTALGTLKPSYAVPRTMDIFNIAQKKDIYVAGIDGLKDFDSNIIADGLKKQRPFAGRNIHAVNLPWKGRGARDFSALDIASSLEDENNSALFTANFMKSIPKGAGAVIPPVLGVKPSYKIYDDLVRETECGITEVSAIAPAVTGFRLRAMLLDILKYFETEIIENAAVTCIEGTDRKCERVVVSSAAGIRTYNTNALIMATGGFYGGGIVNENGHTYEPVTGLPVYMPDTPASLDFTAEQEFAKCGVMADKDLNALGSNGEKLYDNVFFAGRILMGADSAYEISGNGTALASAYAASKKV